MSDEPAAPAPEPLAVRLREDGAVPWQPVSPRLVVARAVLLLAVAALPLAGAVVLAALVTPWAWLAVAAVLCALACGLWVVRRQVPAISWAEGPEELVIRRGRLFRSLVSVPYGRLQFVDLQSGPLQRRLGLATIELHTASPASGGSIPGLPTELAEGLRERLAARGESQRAGL
ncbi:PH domain-containing protein [Pedococcus sp. NPDC057267]|uniref:PH domain-containing protein n=1 Tax=Pedococcus sp. NPDC057267 TaxID=3346077 RepID=UPI0036382759